MNESKLVTPEPWLRGTLTDVPAVHRAVLHALELAKEDLWKWCFSLSDEQLNERRLGIAPVAFHLRHIAGSLDRLLTYAEGLALNEQQLALLKSELEPGARHDQLFEELATALDRSKQRVRALAFTDFATPRSVGKRQLPTTLGGILVHVADHTQRHVGQAITTAKVVAKH
ncbi:MAG: DinB family protein [Candidatus Acidiferrum sp.]